MTKRKGSLLHWVSSQRWIFTKVDKVREWAHMLKILLGKGVSVEKVMGKMCRG